MPLVRSPLSGSLEHGLAYGHFQVASDNTIITANDSIEVREGVNFYNADISSQNELNRWNVKNRLLPVLLRKTRLASLGSAHAKEGESSERAGGSRLVVKLDTVSKAQISQSKDRRQLARLRNPRAASLRIRSLQERAQAIRTFRQSRAQIQTNISGNSGVIEQQLEWSQRQRTDGPARATPPTPDVKMEHYADEARLAYSGPAAISADELQKSDKELLSVTSRMRKQSAVAESEAVLSGVQKQVPSSSVTELTDATILSADKEYVEAGVHVRARNEDLTAEDSDVQRRRDWEKYKAAKRHGMYGSGEVLDLTAKRPRAAEKLEEGLTNIRLGGNDGDLLLDSFMLFEGNNGRFYALDPGLVNGDKVQSETVLVKVEPFVPIVVSNGDDEQSIFGGQVYLLRHVQIEDQHFRQGFMLNETKLIDEVRESAQRLMREGMYFELPQLNHKADDAESAYTAVFDFGFGDLILSLNEVDPGRIARQIGQLRNWYFSIVVVVLMAAALGLLSLWRYARAQIKLAEKKDDFISAVSHELRTPLTSIRMYSEMLEKNWVKSEDKLSEYYRSMRQESERLSRLIENVLDFSRIQKGRKTYTFSLGDLNECVLDVVEMIRPYATQNGFTVKTELEPELQMVFDKDSVKQIIVNLLDNAIKYACNATDRTVIVRTKKDTEYVLIEVEDHGPGVPRRQQKKVFEEFYRLGSEATRETTGTGLGLALVKRFAQAHNGFVEILSAKPAGAIFRVGLAMQI